MPKLINDNQVLGNWYSKNNRANIDLHYTKETNIPGLFIFIDFEQAFDSVNWDFLELSSKKFYFEESCIRWIKTLCNRMESCIINNGVVSRYVPLAGGVRLRDPLSPYLFLLVSEILATKARHNDSIPGIKIPDEELKMLCMQIILSAF